MDSLYSGMSVGFGFLLFCAFISLIWILFKNLKKKLFPQNKSFDMVDFTSHQVEEKREEKRVDIIWPVSFEINNEIVKTETKELSRVGAFVKCSKPLIPGERFVLTIETPENGSISLNAEVVWSNAGIPEEKVVTRGMGIRFMQNPDKDLALLRSTLEVYKLLNSL
ncbi:MAG: PilZ domain-containing protein [Desulfobacteraceae bacterium]